MVFEQCGFSSVFIHKSPVLASYIFARENVILVDSGASVTYIVPIQEGFMNVKGIKLYIKLGIMRT